MKGDNEKKSTAEIAFDKLIAGEAKEHEELVAKFNKGKKDAPLDKIEISHPDEMPDLPTEYIDENKIPEGFVDKFVRKNHRVWVVKPEDEEANKILNRLKEEDY